MILFADDTSIFYSHTDASYLMEVVNLELKKITCWFYTNKLSINVKKSNFIIFRPRQNRQTLDLAFNINNVARKVSKAVGIIYKSSFCLDNSSLQILYFSLIYPYLFYCVSVWASTYPSNLRRLITLQKRVIRIMSKSAFDAHTDPLFKNLKILNLESIYKFQVGKFMYQYRSGLLPDSFNNMFLVTHQVHSYGTRSSKFFHLPQCRTNVRMFSISFQGLKFFNSLSSEIRNATSTASFCRKLKAFLLS
ncbi:uncharacterized protein [Montipora foliosa]|uniref:uncharacterized protein n=1 Tax=Montipora foliosa TaxID=591990 RepID=UPI0035F19C12